MGEKYYICYIPEWDMEEIEPIYVLKAEDVDEEEGEVYVNGKEVFFIDENSNYYADEEGSSFCQPGDLIFEVLGDYIFYRPGINCIAGSANYANDFLIGTPEEIENFKAEYGDEIMKDLGENTINMNRTQLKEMIDLCVKNILKESYGDSDYAIMERAEEMINDAFDYGYIEEGERWEEVMRTNSYIDESAQSLSEEFDINIDEAFNYLQKAFNGYENMYEGKTKHKQVTISESKLKEMIKESARRILKQNM